MDALPYKEMSGTRTAGASSGKLVQRRNRPFPSFKLLLDSYKSRGKFLIPAYILAKTIAEIIMIPKEIDSNPPRIEGILSGI